MWNKKPKYNYKEDVDYELIPDVEAAKNHDPHPWNIKFRGRLIKIHHMKLPTDSNRVPINIDIIEGPEMNFADQQEFGQLAFELALKGLIFRDKN